MNKEKFLKLEPHDAIRYALAKLRDKEWTCQEFKVAMENWYEYQTSNSDIIMSIK